MKAVILAGGLGTRMGGLAGPPKPLQQIGDSPVVGHVMRIYLGWGIAEFVVCVGHRAAEFLKWFGNQSASETRHSADATEFELVDAASGVPYRVTVVDTGQETASGGRLKRIEPWLDDTFLMTYADGLADVDVPATIDFHRMSGADVTMTGVALYVPYGVASAVNGIASTFQEKPTLPGFTTNIGFYVIEPSAVAKWCSSDETSWEGDALPLIAREGRLAVREHDGFWAAMDYPHQHADLVGVWEEHGSVWLRRGSGEQ